MLPFILSRNKTELKTGRNSPPFLLGTGDPTNAAIMNLAVNLQ